MKPSEYMRTSNEGKVEIIGLRNWPGYGADIKGNIYSLDYNQQKYIRKLVESESKSGYRKLTLCKNGKAFSKRVNRVIAEQFLPDYSEELQVNHINGVKSDNTLSNLEMVSGKENIRHAIETGLIDRRGSNHHNAKLNEQQVVEIKSLLSARQLYQTQIARLYGVSKYTVSLIYKNKIWNHVGESK